MPNGKVFKIFLLILILVSCLSFSGLALAGDCATSGSGQGAQQGIPTVTSDIKYLPGWFSGVQQLTLPSTGQVVNTQLIPSGASVNVHVSGVVGFWDGWSHGHDAAYIYDAPPGSSHYPVTTPVRGLMINIDSGIFDPQPPEYNPNHEYDWQTTGSGQSMSFQARDSIYEDNTGSLTVTVSW